MPAVSSVLENIIRTTPRARHLVYRQGDAFVAKTMDVGVPGDAEVGALPSGTTGRELVASL